VSWHLAKTGPACSNRPSSDRVTRERMRHQSGDSVGPERARRTRREPRPPESVAAIETSRTGLVQVPTVNEVRGPQTGRGGVVPGAVSSSARDFGPGRDTFRSARGGLRAAHIRSRSAGPPGPHPLTRFSVRVLGSGGGCGTRALFVRFCPSRRGGSDGWRRVRGCPVVRRSL
jgi:hypothetical protein